MKSDKKTFSDSGKINIFLLVNELSFSSVFSKGGISNKNWTKNNKKNLKLIKEKFQSNLSRVVNYPIELKECKITT